MALFGRKKTYGEVALEEARRADAAEAQAAASASADPNPPSDSDIAPAVTPAPAVEDPEHNPNARMLVLLEKVLAGRFQSPDPALVAALGELRTLYDGRSPLDAKPAIAVVLKHHGHTLPDDLLTLVAEAVTGSITLG